MKKRGKKAQGISFNAIVIAALAIIVLVVLVMIFSGKINLFNQNTTCAARRGSCIDDEGCPAGTYIIMTDDCELFADGRGQNSRPGQCCVPLG